MVSKAIAALGTLKEYKVELEVIEHLLSQRFWSRGKRGKLYERRAVILRHLAGQANRDEKADWLWKNVEGLKEALLDADTGMGAYHKQYYILHSMELKTLCIVYRPNLMKRLLGLEKQLKVPPEERSQCAAELRTANVVELKATRIHPLLFDSMGRPVNGKENTPEGGLQAFFGVSKDSTIGKNPDQVSTKFAQILFATFQT
jgi:Fanconi-associated nuclease 1